MEQYYSDEKNVQILVYLMKQHGIKRVIVSPGSTNVCFVGSIQQDPYFEIYSCVDERSAAYMAVGMAAESNEPVALSCTGATASRNYFPALTEAYYRQLPILVITASQDLSRVGNLFPQAIDRSQQPKDTVRYSVHLQNVKDSADEWDVTLKVNRAILELNHHGRGPVHINLSTLYSKNFMVKTLPPARVIHRHDSLSKDFPMIPKGKIAVYCGTHTRWTDEEVKAVDDFCEAYNAVVFCDQASNYSGKYRVNFLPVNDQKGTNPLQNPDLLIHIGNMSDQASVVGQPKEVWRVSEDGIIADRYHALSNVFEMTDYIFFEKYSEGRPKTKTSYYDACHKLEKEIMSGIPELPFSQLWVASQIAPKLPKGSILHLGILAPLRSWSHFNIDKSIEIECNEGGFGIDGNMSTLVGASKVHPEKMHFGVVGDLSFFYDVNILGNRHVDKNVRILLVNNSLGAEFMLFTQLSSTFVKETEKYIAAGGHNGRKSPKLVHDIATDLGYEYMCAWNKDEFNKIYERFLTPEITDKPMIFEVFTSHEDENEALKRMFNITQIPTSIKREAKQAIKSVLGENNVKKAKEIVKILRR